MFDLYMNETVRTQNIIKLVASILLRIIQVIWISLGLHLEAFAMIHIQNLNLGPPFIGQGVLYKISITLTKQDIFHTYLIHEYIK